MYLLRGLLFHHAKASSLLSSSLKRLAAQTKTGHSPGFPIYVSTFIYNLAIGCGAAPLKRHKPIDLKAGNDSKTVGKSEKRQSTILSG
jgi:hypothetical protein